MLYFHSKQSNVPNIELHGNVGETEPFQQQSDWPGTICLLYIPPTLCYTWVIKKWPHQHERFSSDYSGCVPTFLYSLSGSYFSS